MMKENRSDLSIEEISGNNYVDTPLHIPGLFAALECDRIIELGKSVSMQQGMTGNNDTVGIKMQTRNSRIGWVTITPHTEWVFDRIWHAANLANERFCFDIVQCTHLQITEYPVGGHYDWHEDVGKQHESKRKLSLSVQLSNPLDYKGGDLEFFYRFPEDVSKSFRQRGSAIVFPSYLAHKVGPVAEGTRWSLIAWVFGPAFR